MHGLYPARHRKFFASERRFAFHISSLSCWLPTSSSYSGVSSVRTYISNFLCTADMSMCRPIWSISVKTGFHTRWLRSYFMKSVMLKAVPKLRSPAYARFQASCSSFALGSFTGNGPISSGLTMMNSSGPGSSSSVTSRTCFIHRIVLTLPKLRRSCRTTTSGIHQSILSCSGTSCGRSRRYSRCVTVAVRFAYDRTTRTIGMRSLVIHELTTSFTVTDSHRRWSRCACLVSASHTSSP
uniref:Uncharacterized protein n=1 Tax=Anopheles melas TaxID=34690 RepID=A0A182TXF5_9DIPT